MFETKLEVHAVNMRHMHELQSIISEFTKL
jgi:hypothetical protein